MRAPTVNRRLVAFVAPFLCLSLVLGCPRDQGSTTNAASSASASAPAPSASPSVPASAAWPKVVTIPEANPLDAGPEPELLDIESIDASLDAPDALDADAPSGDAPDAKAKADAYAPLMGTKTYPDENPIKGIRRITSAGAKVHKAPRDANIIATLPKGTEIALVAELTNWYRIGYTDPNTLIRRQGWIYVTTFAGPRMKTCPNNWTHHEEDGGWCDRECTKNTDCKALKGYKCSGTLCFYAADMP